MNMPGDYGKRMLFALNGPPLPRPTRGFLIRLVGEQSGLSLSGESNALEHTQLGTQMRGEAILKH